MSCNESSCAPVTYTPENVWNKMTYNREPFTSMGEMPAGGSWPMNFFKKNCNNQFETIDGKPVAFSIKTPDYFDKLWPKQIEKVIKAAENITEHEKKLADYWGGGVPQNQFIPILQILINSYKLQVIEASRLYDIFNRACNDAAVICWHFKYSYQVPRPVQYCKEFVPYLATPQHPSYPAGHSVIPACCIEIMAHFFPGERDKLYTILEECSFSRLYGGVHYPLDITEGNKLGYDIARKIIETLHMESDKYGAMVDRIFDDFKDAPIMPDYTQYFPL